MKLKIGQIQGGYENFIPVALQEEVEISLLKRTAYSVGENKEYTSDPQNMTRLEDRRNEGLMSMLREKTRRGGEQ